MDYTKEKDDTIVERNGEKTENLHRSNIDSKGKKKQEEGINEYSSASNDSERVQALQKRVKTLEKIIHGSQIHDAGGDA